MVRHKEKKDLSSHVLLLPPGGSVAVQMQTPSLPFPRHVSYATPHQQSTGLDQPCHFRDNGCEDKE